MLPRQQTAGRARAARVHTGQHPRDVPGAERARLAPAAAGEWGQVRHCVD